VLKEEHRLQIVHFENKENKYQVSKEVASDKNGGNSVFIFP
jgi:hypothetical protein